MAFEDLYNKGLKYLQEEKYPLALEKLSSAVKKQPDHVKARFHKAMAHFYMRQFEPAIKEYTHLLENNKPDEPDILSQRGVAWHLSGDNMKALTDLNRCVELDPHYDYRYASRAYIKDKMGDIKGAIADYKKAIELDPENAVSHNNLALLEQKAGYLDKAKSRFKKADELDKNSFNKESSNTTVQKDNAQAESYRPEKNITVSYYLGTIKKILTSKKERSAFLEYLRNLVR